MTKYVFQCQVCKVKFILREGQVCYGLRDNGVMLCESNYKNVSTMCFNRQCHGRLRFLITC